MAKKLLEVFTEDFIREIRNARRYPEAFESANDKFEKRHGFVAFDSYDSFRMKRRRKGK